MTAEPQNRFAFPFPNENTVALSRKILYLMSDYLRRSEMEIQDALGTRKVVGPRIRDLRKAGWMFVDSRAAGPDPDKIWRHQLVSRINQLTGERV